MGRNTFFLYGAEGIARLFSWATVAFLTRHWTDVGTYGQYAVVVNWISIFGVLSELGLNVLVVREVAHRKDQSVFYLRNAVVLRLGFSSLFSLFSPVQLHCYGRERTAGRSLILRASHSLFLSGAI